MKKRTDFAAPLRQLVGVVFFIIIAVTCLQVICRYVFNRSLVWSEELVRFLVVWLCMVGSAVSNFDDDHMTINIIVEKFPRPVQCILYSPPDHDLRVLRSLFLFKLTASEGSRKDPARSTSDSWIYMASGWNSRTCGDGCYDFSQMDL